MGRARIKLYFPIWLVGAGTKWACQLIDEAGLVVAVVRAVLNKYPWQAFESKHSKIRHVPILCIILRFYLMLFTNAIEAKNWWYSDDATPSIVPHLLLLGCAYFLLPKTGTLLRFYDGLYHDPRDTNSARDMSSSLQQDVKKNPTPVAASINSLLKSGTLDEGTNLRLALLPSDQRHYPVRPQH
jgi:hypothetical protein